MKNINTQKFLADFNPRGLFFNHNRLNPVASWDAFQIENLAMRIVYLSKKLRVFPVKQFTNPEIEVVDLLYSCFSNWGELEFSNYEDAPVGLTLFFNSSNGGVFELTFGESHQVFIHFNNELVYKFSINLGNRYPLLI